MAINGNPVIDINEMTRVLRNKKVKETIIQMLSQRVTPSDILECLTDVLMELAHQRRQEGSDQALRAARIVDVMVDKLTILRAEFDQMTKE
jgi:hypothetical protein